MGEGSFRMLRSEQVVGRKPDPQRDFLVLFFLHYPKDSSRYYFRAPDLVKCLTKSEKGYHECMVIIEGTWDDRDTIKSGK